MNKRAPKRCLSSRPIKTQKQYKKKNQQKKKKKKKGNCPQKNTQKQNKIQDLFVYISVTCCLIFNLACINAEPTSKRSNISFPDTYHSFF